MIPLIWGTLKGTLFAMLFVALMLLAAVYTSGSCIMLLARLGQTYHGDHGFAAIGRASDFSARYGWRRGWSRACLALVRPPRWSCWRRW
ncbi:hypothetical protein HS125_08405 [bacterium]|nr:hypothetical protein [bacterium]